MHDFLNDIKRLKNIADIGLLYAKDEYDRERYAELNDISLKMMSQLTDTPLSKIADFYAPTTDYPTPKVDIRALVLNEKNQILLARERSDGHWSLPGGWADVGLTAREVAVKEVFEETGLTVSTTRLLARLFNDLAAESADNQTPRYTATFTADLELATLQVACTLHDPITVSGSFDSLTELFSVHLHLDLIEAPLIDAGANRCGIQLNAQLNSGEFVVQATWRAKP